MRVLTIMARYGVERYPRAEQEDAELFARQVPDVEQDVILVDTAVAPETVMRDRTTMLGSDNRSREFSAFDRAIEWIGPAGRIRPRAFRHQRFQCVLHPVCVLSGPPESDAAKQRAQQRSESFPDRGDSL